ncbi:MAG: flagellar motor switch protein FliM [Burkholderiales bacterium]|nr:flagellar motor switch protein FliM [Burkholderiales bacterium]MDE1929590.1 flagellar motor switch protein FliM [Burkholderiales bacterium]MDE2160777.1 flagellar motor switch protein FliM [Burkholderiales bacterium]MDE2505377.1 flagellar motor switch protein FliM [Burkholderiales bacterium]
MNQQILSQDEVDALLQGITGESQKLEQEEAPTGGLREYDLASQERIVRGRMPTMEVINERFARNIRIGIFNLIRKSPEVAIGGIKVQKFSAFLREIVVPTNFNIVNVKPLRGSGLIVCDPSLVFAVIDSLFGGVGKFHTRIEGRDFSPTELRVILRLVECIAAEFKKAWIGIYPVELEYQRSEMQPQFANIATPSEIVVATNFTLEIGDTTGSIHFCLPYSTLEPIRDVLYSTIQGDAAEPDRRWVNLLKHQLQAAEVELVAELATAGATVEQLLAFKPGDFVELDLDPMIQAKVAGVPVFDAHYGTSNNRYAIKINSLLTGHNLSWLEGSQHG